MEYIVKNALPGRLHFTAKISGKSFTRFSIRDTSIILAYLERLPNVKTVQVYNRTGGIVVNYNDAFNKAVSGYVETALEKLDLADPAMLDLAKHKEEVVSLNEEYKGRLFSLVAKHFVFKLFLPWPLRVVWSCYRAAFFIGRGISALMERKLTVAVLDATAISASMLRNDTNTAGSVMFLLKIGELLEEWTYKKSISDLATSMSLNIGTIWLLDKGVERQVSIDAVEEGDKLVIKMGNTIPLDGTVVAGEAMVNQASMTGESMAVHKTEGISVYAGTVVEEGEITVRVSGKVGETRYERIIHMIENSEKLKSQVESKADNLADKLVPYSFAGTGLAYSLTSDVNKAMSVLMVDFSCALKLSIPLSVLSAMRECSTKKITVKGGKFLEAVALADTIVFDKTGTLTNARPKVAEIVNFSGEKYTHKKLLAYAACLEEHFPHSVANAIVEQAALEKVSHKEMHTKVEYIVAHGIVSHIGDRRIVIGSHHFVFEDEKCVVPSGKEKLLESISQEYSQIYMAIDQELVAVICVHDPLREEAVSTIKELRKAGFKKLVMMTGDSKRTAAAIAEKLGIDEFYAEVLPEDKANYVKKQKRNGHKIVMVGDGINDSPALSAADAGIAIAEGADLAREIADITIGADNLSELVVLKEISNNLMKRIDSNYRFVVTFNAGFILLGILGILTPAGSALFHNLSTIGVGLHSMSNLLPARQ